MGRFWPNCLAFIITCTGTTIFCEAPDTSENGPLGSCYIFLFSLFLLLWDLRVYPISLRKQWSIFQFIIDFLLAEFVMEELLFDFWFPLEKSIIAGLPKLAEHIEEAFSNLGQEITMDWLKGEKAGIYASYTMSIFFLIAVLHATRCIDLRLLECGISTFFSDTYSRLKTFLREITPNVILNWFESKHEEKEPCPYRRQNNNNHRKYSVMQSNHFPDDDSGIYDTKKRKSSFNKRYKK